MVIVHCYVNFPGCFTYKLIALWHYSIRKVLRWHLNNLKLVWTLHSFCTQSHVFFDLLNTCIFTFVRYAKGHIMIQLQLFVYVNIYIYTPLIQLKNPKQLIMIYLPPRFFCNGSLSANSPCGRAPKPRFQLNRGIHFFWKLCVASAHMFLGYFFKVIFVFTFFHGIHHQ